MRNKIVKVFAFALVVMGFAILIQTAMSLADAISGALILAGGLAMGYNIEKKNRY